MVTQHNQTHRDWIVAANESQLQSGTELIGTGVFVIPSPADGEDRYTSVLVPDISYLDAAKRGSNCYAFKWIPQNVFTREQIEEAKQNLICGGQLCLDVSDCRDLRCFCINNECFT